MEAGMCYITTLKVCAESAPYNQPGSVLPLLVNYKNCNYCRRTKKKKTPVSTAKRVRRSLNSTTTGIVLSVMVDRYWFIFRY